jgi:hypothetical protein
MSKQELFDFIKFIIQMHDPSIVCVQSDQNAPAPSGLYASIRVFHNMQHLGSPRIIRTNTEDEITTEYNRQMKYTLSIDFFRKGALEACEFMLGAHRLESVAAFMLANNIGYGGSSSVRNLSALQSTEIEERANIEIELYVESKVIDKTNYIDEKKFTFKITP